MSVGPTTFTGTFPANTNSVPASIQFLGTTFNFTIDSQGHASQTCATATPGGLDSDQLTLCWAAGVTLSFIAPPSIEAIFYTPPGEGSTMGLQQSNSVSTRTAWTYDDGLSLTYGVKDPSGQSAGSLSIQASIGFTDGETITSGGSTGFTTQVTGSMFPNHDNDLYVIHIQAVATWMDMHDGNLPTVTKDLSTGHLETLTLHQLRGLAQTPPYTDDIFGDDRDLIVTFVTPDIAQQFIAEDPFASDQPISQAITEDPVRFIPADPPQMQLRRDLVTSETQVHGSGTDHADSRKVGDSVSVPTPIPGLSLGGSDTITFTVTHTYTNQSTASITLKTVTTSPIEGVVDLYMDTAVGTIVPVPHLEDSRYAPNNHCMNAPDQPHVLLSGQWFFQGDSLVSCNLQWSLAFQPDGTLTEFFVPADGSDPQPVTTFYAPGNIGATMLTNGDFVLYDTNGNILADSGTSSTSGAYLVLQDDGVLAIYNPLPGPGGGPGGALPALWSLFPGG